MKRQNLVVLSGKLQGWQERLETVEGEQVFALSATLVTDHPAYGGHHSVLFPGRVGLEVWAFAQACEGTDLEVTIDGWLRSGRETVVVVDRVMFHVGEAVRREAARRVNQLLRRQGALTDVSGDRQGVARSERR